MLRALLGAAALSAALGAACSKAPVDPLQLDRARLTVSNTTDDAWTDVQIWINRQFRVTVPKIDAHSQFQVSLDSFVEGFGRRFNFGRMQINDLRLSAKTSRGTPVELKKEFQKEGLSGVHLGGKQ